MTITRRRPIPLFVGGLILPLMLSVLTAGCSTDQTESQESVPVVFSSQLGASVTRGISDNIWPDNTKISVFNGTDTYTYQTVAGSSALASGEAAAIKPITAANGSAFFWPINAPTPAWQFSAWYPMADTAPSSLTVSDNQTATNLPEAEYANYDILYCPAVTSTFRQAVPLVFYHQAARVIVRVNSSFTEGREVVESMTFGGGRLALSGTLTPGTSGEGGTAAWTTTGTTTNTITMRDRSTEEGKALCNYVFECILPPQSNTTVTGQELIKMTTSGGTDDLGAPEARTYTHKDVFDLKAGYLYTYNLIISEKGTITLSTVKVVPWSDPISVPNTAVIPDNNYPGL